MKTTVLALLIAAVPAFAQTAPYVGTGPGIVESTALPEYASAGLNPNLGYATLHNTPLYYATGEVLIWTRRNPSGALFVNQYTGETTADFRDLYGSYWAAGPNITVGRELGDCWNAEFTYFGLYNQNMTDGLQAGQAQPILPNLLDPTQRIAAEILPLGNFRVAGVPLVTLDPRDRQTVKYSTTLNNFEINLRKNATDRFSWLVGFRYIGIMDDFMASFTNFNGVNIGGYGVNTHNDLFGGQFGADYTAAIADPLYLRMTGKVGLFGNAASQSTYGNIQATAAANQPLIDLNRSASRGQLSFMGQANLSFVYECTPRFHLTGGYSAMVVTGVAAATAQSNASDFSPRGAAGISTGANAFYQGMNFGIEYHH